MKNTALRTSRLLIVASFVAVASVLGLSAAQIGSNSSSTMWPGGNWMPPAASYGTKQDLQVSVPMSDGVVLKADISYPTDPTTGNRAPGPFPVLLTQTPYASKKPTDGDFFVQRGYIYVTAYVRGTLTSGGSYGFFSDRDAKDGAELVAWAAGKVRNSNGVVGLHGDSYMAITQMFTVAAAGPGSPVKAMAASCMGAEFYPETYFAGGIPTQTMNFQRVIGKLMGGDTAASGSATLADVLAGGDKAYYRDFWKARTVGNLVQQAVDTDVPLLLYSSSGDIYAQSSMDLYAYLQNAYAKRPIYGPMHTDVPATGRYQIIMGQGGHCKNQDVTIQLEWFETWLKKQPTNMEKTTMPIHVNEQISSKWFNTSHYPVVSAYTKYFLDNSGTLSQNQPSATAEETLPWAQPSASSRAQYESPIFSEGATLAGPITASLFASSTTSNLELIGTLQEIALDGTVTTLTSGTVLGSMSQNDPTRSWVDKNGVPVRPYGKYDADRYVPAGTIKQYDFLIYSRFAFVRPGSKLRFVLTTQAPTDICSPFLGTDPCFPTAPQTASLTGSRITIHHGPSYPSAVNLPLLKAGCWNPSGKVTGPFWKTDPTMPDTTSPCQE
jgi:predicted acyl esterase